MIDAGLMKIAADLLGGCQEGVHLAVLRMFVDLVAFSSTAQVQACATSGILDGLVKAADSLPADECSWGFAAMSAVARGCRAGQLGLVDAGAIPILLARMQALNDTNLMYAV